MRESGPCTYFFCWFIVRGYRVLISLGYLGSNSHIPISFQRIFPNREHSYISHMWSMVPSVVIPCYGSYSQDTLERPVWKRWFLLVLEKVLQVGFLLTLVGGGLEQRGVDHLYRSDQ